MRKLLKSIDGILFKILNKLFFGRSASFVYYDRIFSPEHYGEVWEWANSALLKHPIEDPSFEDGTQITTTGQVRLTYTSCIEEGKRFVHFAASEDGKYTTISVGRTMVFLLGRLLRANKCEEDLFRTQSRVHHAEFAMPESVEWKVTAKEDVIADMEKRRLGELDDKVISFREI